MPSSIRLPSFFWAITVGHILGQLCSFMVLGSIQPISFMVYFLGLLLNVLWDRSRKTS